jgi:hypothetical protein
MASLLSNIKAVVLKGHFLATLAMFLFIGLMVVENDMAKRGLLLLPVIVCFYAAKLLFTLEQAERVDDIIARYKAVQEKKKQAI